MMSYRRILLLGWAILVLTLVAVGCAVRGRLPTRPADTLASSRVAQPALPQSATATEPPLPALALETYAYGEPALPLGILAPAPNLLPAGAVSVTLSLTTTQAADCRWSDVAGTTYSTMPYAFQKGQGTRTHSTEVNGLAPLDDRHFFVRCRDLAGGREPDRAERNTHLRVLGPWNGGYPRIANLWGIKPGRWEAGFLAGFSLIVPYAWKDEATLLPAIRELNPASKILLNLDLTHGRPEAPDSLAAPWSKSRPGEPGYRCLLRDSGGQILLVRYWGHPMYNLTQSYCRSLILQKNFDAFFSARVEEGDDLAYDGMYWDLIFGHITWLGPDIDADLDGRPDDPTQLNAAYQAGLAEILAKIRSRLPAAILAGNEAALNYANAINGRLFEWQLANILNGHSELTWNGVMEGYWDWLAQSRQPATTILQAWSEALYAEKFPFGRVEAMPPAVLAEAATGYQRMRYGLASALLGDGLYSFDLGSVWHGQFWWYDEYGAPPGTPASPLPPLGYLGQPTGAPALLVARLTTPDQVRNGDFADGPRDWNLWVDYQSGAAATMAEDGAVAGTGQAHIVIARNAEPSSVMLYQRGLSTQAGQAYTLSFWARSTMTLTLSARITQASPPGQSYGFDVQGRVTPQWQHFHLWGQADTTASNGELDFLLGAETGEVWLDGVQFQPGALGVWARPFEHGLAVVNTTPLAQTVPLSRPYCKLNGSQAPLFQARVDDDAAELQGSWTQQPAGYTQFGQTVHVSNESNGAIAVYRPTLAYAGSYEVLTWVAPGAGQSPAARVEIHHAQDTATVFLDESSGDVGWHSLGSYPFDAGDGGSVALIAAGHGTVVADALKWVSTARYNDGSQIDQVSLQPQDGIVLVLCDDREPVSNQVAR